MNQQNNISHKNSFRYLYLSVHNSRDEREFDISNYKLLQNIFSQKELKKNRNLKKNININGYINYLNSFKESKYLIGKNLYQTIAIDILKYIKQILDIAGLSTVVFFSIFFKTLKSKKNQFKNKKIYSTYYWKAKKGDSANYYYPSINKSTKKEVFIISFAYSKILTLSLLDSLKISKYISPCNILNLKGLFLSIFQFIHLFIYDFYLAIFKKKFKFLRFWIGWKKGAEIFYSLLTYNSISQMASICENCEFISWHENQVTNNSFALGVTNGIEKNKNVCHLSSYIGSPLSIKTKKQFLPTKRELNIGICGKNFYLQDKDSKKEMDLYLKENNIQISTTIIEKSMLRINPIKKENNLFIKEAREITIFTNDSYLDLIACMLSLFNPENKLFSAQKKEINNPIFIRLHPSLKSEKAIYELKEIEGIPDQINLKFIDHKRENIIGSIKKSNYCIFGLSTYINLAIELKCNVIGVETNHINSIPTNSNFVESPYLKIINPW